MQITETVNQELRREYKVVIPANDLEKRLSGKIAEVQPRMNLKDLPFDPFTTIKNLPGWEGSELDQTE